MRPRVALLLLAFVIRLMPLAGHHCLVSSYSAPGRTMSGSTHHGGLDVADDRTASQVSNVALLPVGDEYVLVVDSTDCPMWTQAARAISPPIRLLLPRRQLGSGSSGDPDSLT